MTLFCHLVIPLWQVALAQLYKIISSSERQCGERQASLKAALCWFQTSLPLAALPLPRLIIACCFRVGALSSHAALALSPSCIAPELNRIQLSAICRGGQSGKGDAACRLVIPLRQAALAQLYKNHHQSGNAASGKLV